MRSDRSDQPSETAAGRRPASCRRCCRCRSRGRPTRRIDRLKIRCTLPRRCRDHARVQSRAIAVVLAVHLVRVVGVGQLHQIASFWPMTFDETQRSLLHALLNVAWEDAGEGLESQIQDLDELSIAAGAAAFYWAWHVVLGPRSDQGQIMVHHQLDQVPKAQGWCPSEYCAAPSRRCRLAPRVQGDGKDAPPCARNRSSRPDSANAISQSSSTECDSPVAMTKSWALRSEPSSASPR